MPIFGSKRPKMGPKAPIFTKKLDVRFLMAFYSKTRACIEAYSTLSETQYYFQSGKMCLQGIKCIFWKLLGSQYPCRGQMAKNGRNTWKCWISGYFKAFHSKTRAFIKSYSTLCETQRYFELVKMYLQSLKCIFRNLLGP